MTDANTQTAFVDLSHNAFPFTVEFLDAATGEVYFSHTVTEPGALHVPACTDYGVEEARVRIIWADGHVTET